MIINTNKNLIFIETWLLFLILFYPLRSLAYEKTFQLDDAGKHEFSFELDQYYSNVSYIFSLTDKSIPKEPYSNEKNIYYYLIKNIYMPQFVLLEASIYPLPIAGVYIKKNTAWQEKSQISENINIVRSITAGFPEPWAFSFFLGNVVDFIKEDKEVVGKGFSGLLFSYGNKHIVDNTMVDDNWFETEIKVKGSDVRKTRDISWSYAIGYKKHYHPDIKDALYISIKRNRIDYILEGGNPILNIFTKNSEQEVRIDFDPQMLGKHRITRYLFLFGKKLVVSENVALSLSVGALKTNSSGYSGRLKQRVDEHWSLIFRPNVHINF
ncbi:MAG: hypothetical protein JXN64_08810 [Spirochaetes bacterium]|nr:hypothetical protein [Spirochaetota bacterium]